MARGDRGKAAYRHVDITKFEPEIQAELQADADAGGGDSGLRVVEIVHNGPAQAPIYGVYNFDEEKWSAWKSEANVTEEGQEDLDLTDKASTDAAAEAERVRKAEEEELAKIDKGDGTKDKTQDAAKLAEELKNKNHKR